MVLKKTMLSVFLLLFCLGFRGEVNAFSDGYILGAHHMNSAKVYLFDKDLEIIHTWSLDALPAAQNGYSSYILPNGNLLRSGVSKNEVASGAAPQQGSLSEIDYQGNVVWTYLLADLRNMMHHDFKPMPNGNVLIASYVHYTKDEAIAAGLDSSLFTGNKDPFGGFGKTTFNMMGNTVELESIMELEPDRSGANDHKIVWQWNIVDHIVPVDQALSHPEKFRADLGPLWAGQWVHLNGIDYNPIKDLIVFSSRIFSEFYIIDHSTSTQEAAGSTGGDYGKGGDLLFRWGRPSNYCEPTGTRINTITNPWTHQTTYDTVPYHDNDVLYVLHCPTWIPEGYPGEGNILFYHNNVDAAMSKLGNSQAMEVTPDMDAEGNFIMKPGVPTKPLTPTWLYEPNDVMFSQSNSSALRMPSGNTLIEETYPNADVLSGTQDFDYSILREVDPDGNVIWGPQSIALPDSTPFNAARIMYYPSDDPGIRQLLIRLGLVSVEKSFREAGRAAPEIHRTIGTLSFSNVSGSSIMIYTIQGKVIKKVRSCKNRVMITTADLAAGSYIVKIHLDGKTVYDEVISLTR